jgi:hypothetical protein
LKINFAATGRQGRQRAALPRTGGIQDSRFKIQNSPEGVLKKGRVLAHQGTLDRIGQQYCPDALPLGVFIDRRSSNQRSADRVFWQLPAKRFWMPAKVNG